MNQQHFMYFKNWGTPPLNYYKNCSPDILLTKINQDSYILDVGCGENKLKPYFKNLIGIDPVFSQADFQIDLEDYHTKIQFDVALCFSSLIFGTDSSIDAQISKIVSLLKPKSSIFWRLVPYFQKELLTSYEWSHQKLNSFAIKYKYLQTSESIIESNKLYAEWHRE
jgi:hypothetical protein